MVLSVYTDTLTKIHVIFIFFKSFGFRFYFNSHKPENRLCFNYIYKNFIKLFV